MIKRIIPFCLLLLTSAFLQAQKTPTDYVNPFYGTAPITEIKDIGFVPPKNMRVWAGLTFPGSSVPNAMVQLSPITEFGSGAGYEYEDTVIYAFTHTNKGHWNLCNVPLLAVTGEISADNFQSTFSHKNETAKPGYYQVYLERYGINAEMTSTLRCGYHKYTYQDGQRKRLVAYLEKSNERIRDWKLLQDGENVFKGYQETSEKIYFYAISNHVIKDIELLKKDKKEISVINFKDAPKPLELKIGFSYVSMENAKENLEKEIAGKNFEQVKNEASRKWETLLSKIKVTGGTERQKTLFYSYLYRSFLWPALRSDVNGEFTDEKGNVVRKDFNYYTIPSLWDDYRNKLVLLGIVSPIVTNDVIKSLIDRGEKTGFIPTFFHGDHASVFIAGSYLRGIKDFDIKSAYNLLLRNATLENKSRPHLMEYIKKGYISEPDIKNPNVETVGSAGVTKTLEYAYDDYAVALLAKELGDSTSYNMLMKRAGNFKNFFDPVTGLMRGRLENGDFIKDFIPDYPYYEYMYREANAWQSSFFAPQDPKGLIALYPSKEAFESKLDSLFTIPWNPNYIAYNINSFIGQYCHGNQPDHNYPYLYCFVGKQEKTQLYLDSIMNTFYDMGKDHLAMCGMDDAGEMSAWYVFNAMGLYPFSPADAQYIVTAPLFDKVEINCGEMMNCTILKKNAGRKISSIKCGDKKTENYFISQEDLKNGKTVLITTKK